MLLSDYRTIVPSTDATFKPLNAPKKLESAYLLNESDFFEMQQKVDVDWSVCKDVVVYFCSSVFSPRFFSFVNLLTL